MLIHLNSFRKWVKQVYATNDEELDCDGFFNLIPQYVDSEVAGDDRHKQLPGVTQHLDLCAECYDLYLTLRDVALLEEHEIAAVLTDPQRS